jgi:hypothetical protein
MDEQASVVGPRTPNPGIWISAQTGRPTNLVLKRNALWIVLLPMLVYFFADVFFETFANPEIVIPPPDGPVLADSEAANRYFFLTSYFALISITTGICLYFWSDTRSILDRPSRLAVRLVGVVLICLLGYSVVARGGDSPKTYNFIGQALFAKALCTAPLPGKLGFLARRAQGIGDIFLDPTTLEAALCKGIATRGNSLASVFAPLQKIDDLFIGLAVPALILGCVSALALPCGEVPYDVEVHILSVQVRRVKAYLYLSALLLLVIVVLTISWMTFPTYLLAGEPAKRYDALVHSISAYYGLQYVLILCSYYIPVSLRLSRRIRGLAYRAIGSAQAPNEQMLEDWEQKSGLLLHDLRSYNTVAALLAPLFPGIIGAVLAVAGK